MKKLFYIIILLILCTSCSAQTKLQKGHFTFKGKTVGISDKYGRFSARVVGDHDDKAYPPPKNPNAFPVLKSDIHIDFDLVKEIILKIIEKKTATALITNREKIGFGFGFAPTGEILGIHYLLQANTSITAHDIVIIDEALKAKVKASFTGKDYLDYYIISYPTTYINF